MSAHYRTIAFAIAAVFCAPACAKPLVSPFIPLGAVAETPRGMSEMCVQEPGTCQAMTGAKAASLNSSNLEFRTGLNSTIPVCPDIAEFMPTVVGTRNRQASGPFLENCERNQRIAPSVITFGYPDFRTNLAQTSEPRTIRFVVNPVTEYQALLPPLPVLGSVSHQRLSPDIWDLSNIKKPSSITDSHAIIAVASAVSVTGINTLPYEAIDTPQANVFRPRVEMTVKAFKSLLHHVNDSVNGAVIQQNDMMTYGVGELWHRSGSGRHAVGDCEDIAIEKRLKLLDAGVPADRLFFAVVYHRGIGLHTVLMARLPTGDVVLDSRHNILSDWRRTGYDYIVVEVAGEPTNWRAIA